MLNSGKGIASLLLLISTLLKTDPLSSPSSTIFHSLEEELMSAKVLTGAVKFGANDNSYAVGGNYFIQIIPMFSPCVDTFNYPSHICHKSTCIIFFYDVLIVAFLKISWHFCVITLLCETSRHIPKSSAYYENIITQLKCPSISIRSWFSGGIK